MSRNIKSLVALILVVGVLAGCSSHEKSVLSAKEKAAGKKSATKLAKDNVLFAAVAKTKQEDSARITGTVKVESGISSIPLKGEIALHGIQSFTTGDAQYDADLAALYRSVTGDSVSKDAVSYKLNVRIISNQAYVQLPGAITDKPVWIVQEINNFAKTSGAIQNPNQYLDYLQSTSSKITKVGKEDIDGVSTTHYSGTVDPAEYKKRINAIIADDPESSDSQFQSGLADAFTKNFKKAFPVDVWIDSQGRVRQVRYQFTIGLSSLLQTTSSPDIFDAQLSYNMKLKFSDFGKKVSVKKPPEDQIKTQDEYNKSTTPTTKGIPNG